MTDTEKNKILELRSLGYGYQKIAKEIGISVNSIRNYCSKQNSIITCKECGKKIKQHPGKKKKKFCSDKCRYIWWNKHRDELTVYGINEIIGASLTEKDTPSTGSNNQWFSIDKKKLTIHNTTGGSKTYSVIVIGI